jgi:hypothetical protein
MLAMGDFLDTEMVLSLGKVILEELISTSATEYSIIKILVKEIRVLDYLLTPWSRVLEKLTSLCS